MSASRFPRKLDQTLRKERSKELFQHYCQSQGYRCSCVEKSNEWRVRTPDFEVIANDVRIIVEAKDVNANDADIRNWRDTRSGKIVVHSREPGKRARSLIEDARGQLRAYAQAGVPCVVVLYDNIIVDGIPVSPSVFCWSPISMTDIDVALYGLWQANVRFHPGGRVQSLGDTRSRYRRMYDRQIVSAVIVLYEQPEEKALTTLIYHNYWASTPLPKRAFNGRNDIHFAKITDPDAQPNQWVQI